MADGNFLHAHGAAQWDASDAVLSYLNQNLKAGMRTLETGAGRSTIVFAAAGCVHDVVTPSPSEEAAIRAAAAAEGVDMARVTFQIGFSQDVLPRLGGAQDLDFVFIDGGHGFPIPAVDFQYLAPRLKVGGVMLLDDVDLWTGEMIVSFLKREAGWTYEGTLKGRTAAFRRTGAWSPHEWTKQPYVVAKSFWPQTLRKLRNGVALALRGDVRALARKVDNERKLAEAAKSDF